jgi:hypothetical protein
VLDSGRRRASCNRQRRAIAEHGGGRAPVRLSHDHSERTLLVRPGFGAVNLAQARAQGVQGYAGWNNNTAFGNWGGDGNCSYYNNPDGDGIMIGDC